MQTEGSSLASLCPECGANCKLINGDEIMCTKDNAGGDRAWRNTLYPNEKSPEGYETKFPTGANDANTVSDEVI